MKCKVIQNELMALIDKETKDRRTIMDHLDHCLKCRMVYNQLQTVTQLVSQTDETIEISADYDRVFFEKLAAIRTPKRSPLWLNIRHFLADFFRLKYPVSAAVASLGVLLVVYAAILPLITGPSPKELELLAYLEVAEHYDLIDEMDLIENYELIGHLDYFIK